MRNKKGNTIKTPSQFGSHASMVVEDKTGPEPDTVVLLDEIGEYWTYTSRLDNGFADPKRWATRGR